MKTLPLLVVVAAVANLAACTRYAHRIDQPQRFAQVVGDKPVTIDRDGLTYRLTTEDNRLNIRVTNNAADPLYLAGSDSWVVTPDGQSQPVASATIAPGTFLRLALPPEPQTYRETGPRFGVGVGMGTGIGAGSGVGVGTGVGVGSSRGVVTGSTWTWSPTPPQPSACPSAPPTSRPWPTTGPSPG